MTSVSTLARRATAMTLMEVALMAATIGAAGPARAADACDALTARVIRATGASLAGRTGPLAVFRAEDAERMSLDCRAPRRMILAARDGEPIGPFLTLIGLSAQGLAGARPDEAEALARRLHHESLLARGPRQGSAGGAAIRCETGPRGDGLSGAITVCILAPSRRSGLLAGAKAG